MLDLCLKGYLAFEPVEGKTDQIRVILKQKEVEKLPKDEQIVYQLLQKIPNKENNSFTMKEFEKYSNKYSSRVLLEINKIEEQAKVLQQEKGHYDEQCIKTSKKYIAKGVGYLFLGIFSIALMQFLIIPALLASIYSFKLVGRYKQLTQKRS